MKARALLFLAIVFLLGACSADDEQFTAESEHLEGRWVEVYEPGVVSEGIVYYTFHEESPGVGKCLIEVYDVFSGDHHYETNYQISDDGKRIILRGGFCATEAQEYEIVKFAGARMEWRIADHKLYFERRE